MNKLSRSLYSKKQRPIKILQFGEGNFLRAFVEWIIQKANDQGLINTNVAVVQPIEYGRIKELSEQDGLYTLYLQGIQQGEVTSQKTVIDVLDDFINPYLDYSGYLNYAKSDDLRFIISNTTEAGIILDEKDIDFNNCPKSFPSKLLALLYTRYKYYHGDISKGLIIIPCELINHNGETLKRVLNDLAKIKDFEDDFINWLNSANTFCDTLVDRIVPGYPKDEIQEMTEALGYEDHSIVKGEIFHLWVIQGSQEVAKEFPVNQAGLNVLFVDDITPYKERKVRILNGAHTALVPVSYLYGIDTVKESVEDPVIGRFLKELIFDEIIPTLDLPEEELEQFAYNVIERFKNPFIRHELLSISLNSTTKYKTRDLPSVLSYIKQKGELPRKLLFSLASLLVFYRGERDEAVIPCNDNPEFLQMYENLWHTYDGSFESIEKIVERFLSLQRHWEVNLAAISGIKDYVAHCTYNIVTKGMVEAIKEVNE